MNEFDVYKNIRFTGNKDISLLPSYLRYAACAVIPFKCNTLTKSIYPLKVNEYLAAGLSVVATSFSDDIIDFKDVIEIGYHHNEFVTAIQRAVQEHTPEAKAKRIAVAESNTWYARVNLFWEITNRYLAKINKS